MVLLYMTFADLVNILALLVHKHKEKKFVLLVWAPELTSARLRLIWFLSACKMPIQSSVTVLSIFVIFLYIFSVFYRTYPSLEKIFLAWFRDENNHNHLFYCLLFLKTVSAVNVITIITVLLFIILYRTLHFTRKRWWDLYLKCVLGLGNTQLWRMEMEEEGWFVIHEYSCDFKT